METILTTATARTVLLVVQYKPFMTEIRSDTLHVVDPFHATDLMQLTDLLIL